MEVFVQDKLEWSFSNNYPRLYTGHYWEQVDPTPCEGHDKELVESLLPTVEKAFPMDPRFAPNFYLLKFETEARVNGWTTRVWDYKADEEENGEKLWKGVIALSGKRTCIHPAMTRYLVGHEYGHVLHYYLLRALNIKETGDHQDAVYKDYADVRGIELNGDYGPGNWSTNIGEIFANDFRILLTGLETEFWPHKHVARPEEVPHLLGWWLEQKEKHSFKGEGNG